MNALVTRRKDLPKQMLEYAGLVKEKAYLDANVSKAWEYKASLATAKVCLILNDIEGAKEACNRIFQNFTADVNQQMPAGQFTPNNVDDMLGYLNEIIIEGLPYNGVNPFFESKGVDTTHASGDESSELQRNRFSTLNLDFDNVSWNLGFFGDNFEVNLKDAGFMESGAGQRLGDAEPNIPGPKSVVPPALPPRVGAVSADMTHAPGDELSGSRAERVPSIIDEVDSPPPCPKEAEAEDNAQLLPYEEAWLEDSAELGKLQPTLIGTATGSSASAIGANKPLGVDLNTDSFTGTIPPPPPMDLTDNGDERSIVATRQWRKS
ncbi:hypothetical protein PDO_5193 [Rhizobium sp. PDO1-076]|uniref:hypothetical protein n=1 Tax=Rhizobium sp. PDO1-076 TaxID=1125979 RepID=UPI00024E3E96|nr:hypothetical protein [Rhizobium sp. PDO1-076]EHS51284.1 hypothetical protein PDO_5193 [Rhizobium sp. PDO1-076]